MSNDGKPPMRRRLRDASLVLVSIMLLIAMSAAWLIHMVTIAVSGSVYFVENNPFILWGEIVASLLIAIFAIFVLMLQIQRLGERRSTDRRREDRRQTDLVQLTEIQEPKGILFTDDGVPTITQGAHQHQGQTSKT